jgi:pimeloyl-ACP methyl ester carboxylesterase
MNAVRNIKRMLCAAGSLAIVMLALGGATFSSPAQAVTCGTYDGKVCSGTAYQYGGGFSPAAGEYGGFGGAYSCTITHTPVVFIHGNGDNATSWDTPTAQVPGYSKAPNSVYQQFKAAGYKDCELFGVTYLSSSERSTPQLNYHKESKYQIIQNFINKVKAYTGQSKVDLVTHSLGVSMAMAGLTYNNSWGSVRRFVNISGGLHGLDSCRWVGYANAYATTCGSQNWYDGYVFGMYPNDYGLNPWTGTSAWYALSNSAVSNPGVSFYTIYAGQHDEIMCATVSNYATCGGSPKLASAANVKAQLMVGAGSNTQSLNWDWSTGSPWNVMGGDTDGVGHFRSRGNTGQIIVNMLNTACTGTGCASGYYYGPYQ